MKPKFKRLSSEQAGAVIVIAYREKFPVSRMLSDGLIDEETDVIGEMISNMFGAFEVHLLIWKGLQKKMQAMFL